MPYWRSGKDKQQKPVSDNAAAAPIVQEAVINPPGLFV